MKDWMMKFINNLEEILYDKELLTLELFYLKLKFHIYLIIN